MVHYTTTFRKNHYIFTRKPHFTEFSYMFWINYVRNNICGKGLVHSARWGGGVMRRPFSWTDFISRLYESSMEEAIHTIKHPPANAQGGLNVR